MKISTLIKTLQDYNDDFGDLDCWVNGEFGINEPVELTLSQIALEDLSVILDEDLKPDPSVLHFGGY